MRRALLVLLFIVMTAIAWADGQPKGQRGGERGPAPAGPLQVRPPVSPWPQPVAKGACEDYCAATWEGCWASCPDSPSPFLCRAHCNADYQTCLGDFCYCYYGCAG
jgi:hypothetical protein